MSETIKSYKGFDKDLKCRGFQYEIGKEYEEPEADACRAGFHACERPLDVFNHYCPANSRFCEVEQSGELSRDTDDSKVASTKIKIGAEIGIPGLVKAQIEWVKAHTTTEHTDPREQQQAVMELQQQAIVELQQQAIVELQQQAIVELQQQAIVELQQQAIVELQQQAVMELQQQAIVELQQQAIVELQQQAIVELQQQAIVELQQQAIVELQQQAVMELQQQAIVELQQQAIVELQQQAIVELQQREEKASVGENGLAVARGNNVKVKGGLGAVLVIAEENESDYDIKDWAAVLVDGETIKADTFYMLKNSEFVEVE